MKFLFLLMALVFIACPKTVAHKEPEIPVQPEVLPQTVPVEEVPECQHQNP